MTSNVIQIQMRELISQGDKQWEQRMQCQVATPFDAETLEASALTLERAMHSSCVIEFAHREQRTKLTSEDSRKVQRFADEFWRLDFAVLNTHLFGVMPQRAANDTAIEPLSIGVRRVAALLALCPIDKLESKAIDLGLPQIARRCREAYNRLRSLSPCATAWTVSGY